MQTCSPQCGRGNWQELLQLLIGESVSIVEQAPCALEQGLAHGAFVRGVRHYVEWQYHRKHHLDLLEAELMAIEQWREQFNDGRAGRDEKVLLQQELQDLLALDHGSTAGEARLNAAVYKAPEPLV